VFFSIKTTLVEFTLEKQSFPKFSVGKVTFGGRKLTFVELTDSWNCNHG